MAFDQIILWIMAIGILIGALDKIFGNKLGLGEKFDEGFHVMGPLALAMVGIFCLAPVIANALRPVSVFFYTLLGIDPSMLGSLLANDMGGFSLAMELAKNEQIGLLSGSIVASMLGCTLVFSIPVGLCLIEKEDRAYFSKGLLIGLITVPVGSIVGGFIAGFDMLLVLINTIPVAIISILLVLGLKFIPDKLIRGSILFGQFITIVIYIGLACAAFESITKIVIIPGMTPIMEGMNIVASVGIVLLGTFPILSVISKLLDKPLQMIGGKMGIDSASTAGLIYTLANPIPVFKMMHTMNNRGKIVNTAWLVPATAALGDHLGFTAGVRPDMITPVVISKLIAGILAVILALAMTEKDRFEG